MTATLPPRVLWNEKLYLEFMQKHGNPPLYPKVSEQVDMIPLNRRALFMGGYNPSIIRHNGKLLMAYRYHAEGTAATALALAELDDNFNVTSNGRIQVVGGSIEDPRLFEHRGDLYCCYVDSAWPSKPICITKYGKLLNIGGSWQIRDIKQIKYGKNDGTALEKNWIFFSHDEKLFCIYQSHPEQIVLQIFNGEVVAEHMSPGPRWPYGEIRGGTSPVMRNGNLFRLIHSRSPHEPIPYPWRYYVGQISMSCKPPFEILGHPPNPLLRGSESDDLSETERASCAHHKQKVVFPAGLIEHNGGLIASVGCNDSSCMLIKI